MRSVYDDKSKSFHDAVALGLYNRNNELVGYVPKEFEDEARGALSKGLETKVVDEYDGELNYAPVVRITDAEAREAERGLSAKSAKSGTRSAFLFAGIVVLIICIVIGIALASLMSAID